MKQGGVGSNAVVVQLINEALVEIDPLLIYFSPTIRNNTRPSDAKTIMLDTQL